MSIFGFKATLIDKDGNILTKASETTSRGIVTIQVLENNNEYKPSELKEYTYDRN